MKRSILRAGFVSILLIGAAAVSLRAEDDGLAPASHTEAYVGLLLPYNSIGGDLDGNRAYVNSDGIAGVPDVDGALGAGLVLGLKSNRPSGRAFAIEGSIQGSRHDTNFGNNKAGFGLLSADFKFFPTTGGAVEPWIQPGLCFAGLEVDNGFVSSSGEFKDETYSGDGLNLGVGLMTYLSPRFALHLAAIYRFIRYNDVDYGTRAKLNDDLNGNMLSIEFGATFRFLRH